MGGERLLVRLWCLVEMLVGMRMRPADIVFVMMVVIGFACRDIEVRMIVAGMVVPHSGGAAWQFTRVHQ